jgi:hypothetical protein
MSYLRVCSDESTIGNLCSDQRFMAFRKCKRTSAHVNTRLAPTCADLTEAKAVNFPFGHGDVASCSMCPSLHVPFQASHLLHATILS